MGPSAQSIGLDLGIGAHPLLAGMFHFAWIAYVVALALGFVRPRASRVVLGAGVVAHLAGSVVRGVLIGFFPLTNKFESFSAAALSIAIVALATWGGRRLYNQTVLLVALAAFGAASRFSMDLVYAPPLMRTIWYPLHVPLSFLSYALWVAAGAAGMVWFVSRDPEWLRRVDRWALQGLGLWSLSMIAGGFWGVVAWGAYFLWDPKVIWSVILWFHYATFVHLRLTPSLTERPWVRPALAIVGAGWVFVAYVGTSFFFGASSHAF
jgi:ABC-type transport system involved in cytochrome c biogenesis permease subunit